MIEHHRFVSMFIPVDTCVLINFLSIDRLDLFGEYPGSFVVTDEVAKEIQHPKHPKSAERYKQALKDGYLVEVVPLPEEQIVQLDIQRGLRIHGVHLQPTNVHLGERSVIAFALNRKRTSSLATDDNGAIEFVERFNDACDEALNPTEKIDPLTTPKIIVNLIKCKKLPIKDADTILADWKGNPSCRLKSLMNLTSFRELCNVC